MDTGRLLDGRLKIRHLLHVVAVADAGSIGRAAENLHVTQPVVTRGLAEIEHILGVRLFDRLPRGVAPTVFGTVFLDHARTVLAQLRAADDQVRQLSVGDLGTVHVGIHLAGSNLLLPRAILALRQDHPQVVVTVTEASPDVLQQTLLAGELDLIVGRLGRADGDRLRREKLHDEPIRLVVRRDHPAHHLVDPTLADLRRYPWILPGARTSLRAELEATFAEEQVPLPDGRVECTSIPTLRHLLVSGDFVAALPMFIAAQDDALRLLPTGLRGIRRPVGLTTSAQRTLSPAAGVFVRCLREEGRRLALLAE